MVQFENKYTGVSQQAQYLACCEMLRRLLWLGGGKKHKADTDAGWVVKPDTSGKLKYVWGYKMHLLVDAIYEIPMTAIVTKGNTSDVRQASPLLSQARYTTGKFHPDYVICDAGYHSKGLRHQIKRQYRGVPIIKSHKNHQKWMSEETK